MRGDAYLVTIDGYNHLYGITGTDTLLWTDLGQITGIKGDTGATGLPAGFANPRASVDANVGTPSVTVTASGPDTAKIFNFEFKNLKGDKGVQGDKGIQGVQGDKGDKGDTGPQGISALVTSDVLVTMQAPAVNVYSDTIDVSTFNREPSLGETFVAPFTYGIKSYIGTFTVAFTTSAGYIQGKIVDFVETTGISALEISEVLGQDNDPSLDSPNITIPTSKFNRTPIVGETLYFYVANSVTLVTFLCNATIATTDSTSTVVTLNSFYQLTSETSSSGLMWNKFEFDSFTAFRDKIIETTPKSFIIDYTSMSGNSLSYTILQEKISSSSAS